MAVSDYREAEGRQSLADIQAGGGRAIFVPFDVRRNDDCQRVVDDAVAAFGGLDGVVNGAGVMDGVPPTDALDLQRQRGLVFAPIHQAGDDYRDRVMDINICGLFKALRRELRQMLAQGRGGAIVNIGSIAGLIGLAGTETPMTDAAYKKVMQLEVEKAKAAPAGPKLPNVAFAKPLSILAICDSKDRMATPWEQAAVILLLLSDDASNITGA